MAILSHRRALYRAPLLLLTIASTTLLAGCGGDKAPTGQIVAKVQGEDITRRDVQTELAANNAGGNVDLAKVQPLIVDQIVTRRLLVQEAKRQSIDKTPEYLAAEQRVRELLLANQLAERWGKEIETPSDQQVRAFIDANPQMFAERRILLVDQIRTSMQDFDSEALRQLKTNDQVAAFFTANNRLFERGSTTADTLTMPREFFAQIARLAPGEPFAVPQNGVMTINAIVGAKPQPLPAAERMTAARNAVRREVTGKTLQDQIKSLRSGAKIEYQEGFAPPAPEGGKAPAALAPAKKG